MQASSAHGSTAPAAQDLNDIRAAVAHYLRGFKDGDMESFRRAFAADAILVRMNQDKQAIAVSPVAQNLPAWSSKPDASAGTEDVKVILTGGNMAIASLNLRYGGAVYNDQLNLYRFADGWKIATKLTAVQENAR